MDDFSMLPVAADDDHLHEACGVFGVFDPPVAAALTQYFLRGLAISENLRGLPSRREALIAGWTDAMRTMLEKSAPKARSVRA